jgi:hypothetical protein
MLGSKCGSEVLVAKAIERAIGGEMVLVLRSTGQIHPVWIPLIAKGRNGIESPVEVNSELGVAIPVRTRMLAQ